MRLTCDDAGFGVSSKRSHTIAAAAIDALHTALVNPEHCKHLLLDTYQVTGPILTQGSLHRHQRLAGLPARTDDSRCLLGKAVYRGNSKAGDVAAGHN